MIRKFNKLITKRRIKKLFKGLLGRKNLGYCPICQSNTIFIEFDKWLRDHYQCIRCHSIPRQRALVVALSTFYPNWRDLSIHESSPSSLRFLQKECTGYTFSQFFHDTPPGEYKNDVRCEDLSNLTFPDNSLDILITQDVFEHVLFPFKAFKEIYRVLKPGGAHIFTMPWYRNISKSKPRVKIMNDEIIYLDPPIYHGNPIDEKGSLVTYDWGLDFTDLIFKESGLVTTIFLERNRKMGLDAVFLEVFVSRKI
jgi:SAM-dependent methyltransferase